MTAPTISDPLVMPAAALVLSTMMTELGKTSKGMPVHSRITPGTEVVATLVEANEMGFGGVDECCDGVASVRTTRIFQTDAFPEPANRPQSEGGPVSWAAEFELITLRCGTEPGAGMAPTDAQITADAQAQLDDAAALRRVASCLEDQWPIIDVAAGECQPIPAEGNCIGNSMTITVQLACAEC